MRLGRPDRRARTDACRPVFAATPTTEALNKRREVARDRDAPEPLDRSRCRHAIREVSAKRKVLNKPREPPTYWPALFERLETRRERARARVSVVDIDVRPGAHRVFSVPVWRGYRARPCSEISHRGPGRPTRSCRKSDDFTLRPLTSSIAKRARWTFPERPYPPLYSSKRLIRRKFHTIVLRCLPNVMRSP